MSVINSQPLIGASGQATGYNIERSLRFRSSASAWLSRTPASTTNQQKYTLSTWVKRGQLGAYQDILDSYVSVNNIELIRFFNDDTFELELFQGSFTYQLKTTQVFRDPSAWYHIVVAYDTTQATASNRIKVYVNGVQVTSFSISTYPSQNANLFINRNVAHSIGVNLNNGNNSYYDGYLAEFNFIDGQQLEPSSFGETDTATGVWKPKKYTGTYGTNGYYLKFDNLTSTSTLGNDSSGNGNNWTVNNISLTSGTTYDSMTDVPTLTSATAANYATLNPLNSTATISNGNLNSSAGASFIDALATIECTAGVGKWYFEGTLLTLSSNNAWIGVTRSSNSGLDHNAVDSYRTVYQANGIVYREGTGIGNTTTGTTFTTNDVIGVALDSVTGSISFYKNNTLINTTTNSVYSSNSFFFYTGQNSSSWAVNFGQRPFAYTPPTGFVALNTFNLPTPTIGTTASTQANKYMDATIWTGDGSSTRTITNAGSFSPDFVWIKRRSGALSHLLYDTIRGASTGSVSRALVSNSTLAEGSSNDDATYGYLDSFTSTGFTTVKGTDATTSYTNQNSATYVAWQWRASDSTAVSNTAGTITSTVSANTSAGFSIVTYAGSGANATVGHGLSAAPTFMIVKNRTLADDHCVYHVTQGANNYAQLNLANAFGANSTIWNNTTPTSSVFSVGTYLSKSGSNYVAYCFSDVAGYSRFGSYTGNGSSDGPFVYLGFRPKFLLIKSASVSATSWLLLDSSRNTFNIVNSYLIADGTGAEGTYAGWDFVSNGFKIRNTAANGSGETVIYAAFAENPFKYSLAR